MMQVTFGPRILVVRLGAMGDVIHALPAAAALRSSFPHSHLSWLIEPRWAPLLAGNRFVDEVLLLDRSGPGALLACLRKLWGRRFDFAVDFQGLLKSALAASVTRPERIYGFHHSQARERAAALFYSHHIRARSVHVVDRCLELAAAAGASTAERLFPLPAGKPEGELPEEPFVLASPLAGWPAKQWPPERYSELALRLLREVGLPLVLNAAPTDAHRLAGLPGARLHVSGIEGLIYATRRAAAVVGVDSGPMHLAAALNLPGVAIFGPTDPERNGPCTASLTVLRSPQAVTSYKRRAESDPSMWQVQVEDVLAAIKERLPARRQAARPH